MQREMLEALDKKFPYLSFAGAASWVQWLVAVVEECLGNMETIEAYLKMLGLWDKMPDWAKDVLNWLAEHYQGSRDIEEPVKDVSGMTCAQAFAQAGAKNADCAKIAQFMASKKHPLANKLIENWCLRAYRKAHPGQTAIDWQKIIDWVVTNGPAILQFIMTLIAMFGG
jgi:hypothetical protein